MACQAPAWRACMMYSPSVGYWTSLFGIAWRLWDGFGHIEADSKVRGITLHFTPWFIPGSCRLCTLSVFCSRRRMWSFWRARAVEPLRNSRLVFVASDFVGRLCPVVVRVLHSASSPMSRRTDAIGLLKPFQAAQLLRSFRRIESTMNPSLAMSSSLGVLDLPRVIGRSAHLEISPSSGPRQGLLSTIYNTSHPSSHGWQVECAARRVR